MKGVKKAAKLGIRWKLITYFALFVAVILVLLWLFQTVFLDSFYKAIKTRNAQACGDSIVSKINSPNLGDYINELARQNDVCVRVVNGEMRDLYSTDISPDCLIHHYGTFQLFLIYNYTKENGDAVRDSASNPISVLLLLRFRRPRDRAVSLFRRRSPDGTADHRRVRHGIPDLFTDRQDRSGTGGAGASQFHHYPHQPLRFRPYRFNWRLLPSVALLLSLVLAVVLSQKISKPIIKTNNAAKELAQGNYEVSFEGRGLPGNPGTEFHPELRRLRAFQGGGPAEGADRQYFSRPADALDHDRRVQRNDAGYPGENTPENAQIILDETTRLTNLVNDMLNLSRLQSGTQTLTLTEFSLTQEIREILARYNSLTKRDGYHIVFDYKEDVTVEADQVRMSQVIYNLVNNAVNYAGQDKEILVRQRLKPGFVGWRSSTTARASSRKSWS